MCIFKQYLSVLEIYLIHFSKKKSNILHVILCHPIFVHVVSNTVQKVTSKKVVKWNQS